MKSEGLWELLNAIYVKSRTLHADLRMLAVSQDRFSERLNRLLKESGDCLALMTAGLEAQTLPHQSEQLVGPCSHLSYLSRCLIPMTSRASEMEKILTGARARNSKLGITGLLVSRGDYFIQVLEGDASALEYVYQKISLDPRHGGLRILFRGERPQRSFSGWSMAHYMATAEESRELKVLCDGVGDHVRNDRLSFAESMGLLEILSSYRVRDNNASH